jgi:hypothetical protein
MLSKSTTDQRRAHWRYEIRLGAEVMTPSGIVRGATHDVSRGGCRMESVRPLPENELLAIELCVMVDGVKDLDYPPMRLQAQVRWTAEGVVDNQTVQLAGLEFRGITEAQARWLEQVMKRES